MSLLTLFPVIWPGTEHMLVLAIFCFPPFFILVTTVVLLASFGKSFGMRERYVNVLLRIFEVSDYIILCWFLDNNYFTVTFSGGLENFTRPRKKSREKKARLEDSTSLQILKLKNLKKLLCPRHLVDLVQLKVRSSLNMEMTLWVRSLEAQLVWDLV